MKTSATLIVACFTIQIATSATALAAQQTKQNCPAGYFPVVGVCIDDHTGDVVNLITDKTSTKQAEAHTRQK